MSHHHTSRNLELLNRLFPGQAFVSIADTARACALSHKTIRNRIAHGTWPTPTVKLGSRRVIPVTDLATYLDDLTNPNPVGRPRSSGKGV